MLDPAAPPDPDRPDPDRPQALDPEPADARTDSADDMAPVAAWPADATAIVRIGRKTDLYAQALYEKQACPHMKPYLHLLTAAPTLLDVRLALHRAQSVMAKVGWGQGPDDRLQCAALAVAEALFKIAETLRAQPLEQQNFQGMLVGLSFYKAYDMLNEQFPRVPAPAAARTATHRVVHLALDRVNEQVHADEASAEPSPEEAFSRKQYRDRLEAAVRFGIRHINSAAVPPLHKKALLEFWAVFVKEGGAPHGALKRITNELCPAGEDGDVFYNAVSYQVGKLMRALQPRLA